MNEHERSDVHPTNETVVLSNREVAPGVYCLRFPRSFDFVAGQVVAITASPDVPARYYSIASGARDEGGEILYDVVQGGCLTPVLSRMSAGDRLLVSEPFGSFVDRGRPTWWIATGTGIAPFLSMLRSGLGEGRTLVHGARTLDRFYYRDYLAGKLGERYVCCCSTESSPSVFSGRLTAWLGTHASLPASADYMLCGGAGMVVEVRDLLIARGVPFEKISAEIYF